VLSVPVISPEQSGMKTGSGDGTQSKLYFCAEQVSHHPPSEYCNLSKPIIKCAIGIGKNAPDFKTIYQCPP
jgi:hypothetical protein